MDGENFNNGQNYNNNQNNQDPYGNSGEYDNSYTSSQYYQTYSEYSEYSQPAPVTPGFSIAGLVLGILSIVVCCFNGGGIILAIPGVILSVLGNRQNKSGVGTAGLICSIVGTIFNAIVLFIVIIFFIVGNGIKNMII